MRNFSVDYNQVAKDISKRSYKFADVSHKFEKVAYDVYRVKDGNPEELWQIENAEDGDYIVAIYDEEKLSTASKHNDWAVILKGSELHVFYKNEHFTKMSAAQIGFADKELSLVKAYLPVKLAENKHLVSLLLKSVDQNTRTTLLNKYPELA